MYCAYFKIAEDPQVLRKNADNVDKRPFISYKSNIKERRKKMNFLGGGEHG